MSDPEHQLAVHRLTHREPALAARSWLLTEEARDVIVEGLLEPDAEPHAGSGRGSWRAPASWSSTPR
jgi:hypothetical protein